jgi:subtilase family serine protease
VHGGSRQRLLGALAVVVVAGLAGTPSVLAAGHGRRAVAASSPYQTRGAADTGAVARAAKQTLRVYLAPRGGVAALEAAVADVSTPGGANYGRFLTPSGFRARFAPTAATITAIKRWLRSEGLRVHSVERFGRYVTVTGSAAAVEAAFATPLHSFSRGNVTFQAPTKAATVPASVATSILAVAGLSTERHTMKPKAPIPPPNAFVNGRPCSKYYGQIKAKYQADFTTPLPTFNGSVLPYASCGYEPRQFRGAYEGDAAANFDGSGQSVGILDAYAAPTIEQDANTYATRHGDPAFAPGQLTQTVPTTFTNVDECGASGWFSEETLDVEAVHAMAPGAGVHYYGATSCLNSDIADTLDQVVDDNAVSIVSNSYGSTEADENADDIAATTQAFLQGAMQGITFFFSSGDNGDELDNTGTIQADYPASNPWITAVGGTSAGIGPSDELLFQTGWGTEKYSLSADGSSWTAAGFLYGSGGGFSSVFNRPDYQRELVPPTSPPGRAVPDVALDGDPTTGMLIGETQQFPSGPAYGEYRIGGTSLSSPLMAGFQALTLQRAGARQGFLNPSIYRAAKNQPQLFRDVAGPAPDAGNVRADYANGLDPSDGVLYSVRTFNQDSSLTVTPGWDDVTGVGSPSPRYIEAFNTPTG